MVIARRELAEYLRLTIDVVAALGNKVGTFAGADASTDRARVGAIMSDRPIRRHDVPRRGTAEGTAGTDRIMSDRPIRRHGSPHGGTAEGDGGTAVGGGEPVVGAAGTGRGIRGLAGQDEGGDYHQRRPGRLPPFSDHASLPMLAAFCFQFR